MKDLKDMIVRIPGPMPGACVMQTSVPVFPHYFQPTRAVTLANIVMRPGILTLMSLYK